MTSPDLAVQDVIETLDSFYCHNVIAALRAGAVANRLEGTAIYLLRDESPDVAGQARAAAARPAASAAPSPPIAGSSSTARPATTSSPSPTARTRGPWPPTLRSASTPASRPTRPSRLTHAGAQAVTATGIWPTNIRPDWPWMTGHSGS